MHSAEMGLDTNVRALHGAEKMIAAHPSAAKFVPLSQLRKLRRCEQVAAVCYRLRGETVEFLLVRTRGERWIFPKGNTEPGLTHAQAAALEAFEEAGVHGRMEEVSFTRYTRGQQHGRGASSARAQIVVNAHLCEVSWLETPQEEERVPTWFSARKAKRCLRDGRPEKYATELTAVIDQAVKRVRSKTRSSCEYSPKVFSIEKFRPVRVEKIGKISR